MASAVILHNVVDMTRILQELKAEGKDVVPEDLNYLSPHLTSCVKRFGDYALDLAKPPEPWLDGQLPPRKLPRGLPNQRVLSFMRDA